MRKKETLISLDLLKRWDLVHESFPFQTVSDYIYSRKNKSLKAYSSLYDFHSQIYEESTEIKKPSKKCNRLRDEIMGKWLHAFKEELEPTDRMNVPLLT